MKVNKKLKSLIILSIILAVLFAGVTILKNIFLGQIKKNIEASFGFDEIHLSLFPPALIIEDVRSTTTAPFFSARKITAKISYRSLLSRERPLNVQIDQPILRIYPTSSVSEDTQKPLFGLVLPFALERGLVKNGEFYYWGDEFQLLSKGVNARLTQNNDRFIVQAEAEENVLSFSSSKNKIEGKASFLLEGQGIEITIKRARIRGPDGTINVTGRLVNPFDPELELVSSFNVKTNLIVDLFELPFEWEGDAKGKGILTRSNRKFAFNSEFSSNTLVLNDVYMGNVDGKIDFDELDGGHVEFRMRKKDLAQEYLSIRFKGDRLEGSARGFYLDPIMNFMLIPWPVSSPAWGDFSITQRRLRADIEFRDQILDVDGSNYPFKGQVNVDWDGEKKFSFTSPGLSSSFADVEFEGEMTVGENVDFNIIGEVLDVKQAREFTSLVLRKEFKIPEIRGKGSANLRIFGDFIYPKVQADFALTNAGFDKFDVTSVTGNAEAIKNDFKGKFDVDDPFVKGKIDLITDVADVKTNFQIEKGQIEWILPAFDVRLPLTGEASGNFDYLENEEGVLLSGNFSSSIIKLAGQPLTKAEGKVDWRGESFSLPEFRFNFYEGVVEGYMRLWPLRREFDVDLKGEKINLSSLYPSIEGDLSINLRGKGIFDQDKASGQFKIKDLFLDPFSRTEADGEIELGFSEKQIDLDISGNFLPGENEFSVSLGIPFSEDTLSGEIKGFFTNFDLLLPWQGPKGRINYLAEISGIKQAPQLKGAIDFQGSVFPFPRFAHAVRDYSGLIFVDNYNLLLRSFTGKLGGGDIQASGSLRLGKEGVENIDLRAEGKNLLLSPLERTRALADGNLTLIKNAERFDLDGEFFIHSLSWKREFDEKFVFYSTPYYQSRREPQFFDDLNLNIKLRADDNAWMENSLGRVRGRFDLSLAGNALLPVVLGDIEAFGGNIYFQDRRFKILRGRVSFFNPMTIEPFLSFSAETYVKDYRVTFSLEGLLDKLNPEFSSSPPLPPEDVLALLALGESFKRTYHYDRSTQLSTASLLSFQLAEEAQKGAERLFSIDRFRIDPFIMGSSAEMTARLTVGKKISRNFFFLYSTNLTTQREEITRIEWELTNDLSIVGMRDEKGRISFDVKIHKRF